MLTHKDLVKKMLRRPAVKAEYNAQAEEFALLDEMLRARRRAGLTQGEVAAEWHEDAGRSAAGGWWWQARALAVLGHITEIRPGRGVPLGDSAAAN